MTDFTRYYTYHTEAMTINDCQLIVTITTAQHPLHTSLSI